MATLIAWYDAPAEADGDGAGTHLIEVVTGVRPRHLRDGLRGAAGWVDCRDARGRPRSAASAAAEVPLVVLEKLLVPRWSVFILRASADESPREWRRLPHPVPGQDWPAGIELGGCALCKQTGLCPVCHGDPDSHSDLVACLWDGRCAVCQGARRLPCAAEYRNRRIEFEMSQRALEEAEKRERR